MAGINATTNKEAFTKEDRNGSRTPRPRSKKNPFHEEKQIDTPCHATEPQAPNKEDISPVQENNNIKTDDVMCIIISTEELSKSYSDQTGKFPITSSRGHKYICVFYHYDTNTIYTHAIKNRNAESICEAWQKCYDMYKAHGESPNIHILDNECLEAMKNMFTKENVTF